MRYVGRHRLGLGRRRLVRVDWGLVFAGALLVFGVACMFVAGVGYGAAHGC